MDFNRVETVHFVPSHQLTSQSNGINVEGAGPCAGAPWPELVISLIFLSFVHELLFLDAPSAKLFCKAAPSFYGQHVQADVHCDLDFRDSPCILKACGRLNQTLCHLVSKFRCPLHSRPCKQLRPRASKLRSSAPGLNH